MQTILLHSATYLRLTTVIVVLCLVVPLALNSTAIAQTAGMAEGDLSSVPSVTDTRDPFWPASELVHGHLALSQSWIDKAAFGLAPGVLASIGAPDYITRHVKGGEEGPWWNTSIPTRFCSLKDINCTREPAREIADSWQSGTRRVIGYYRHIWEKSFADADAEAAPEDKVVCLDEKGAPQIFDKDSDGQGQVFLSLSSSHKDTVKQRMVELAQMGYEAVYLDFKHQSEKGCWDYSTRKAYKLFTGKDVPEPRPDSTFVAELSNPLFRSYLSFNNRQIGIAFKEWQDAGRAVNPKFTLVISASYMNSLTTPHLSTNMFPAGSLAKTEFRLPIVIGPRNYGGFYRAPKGMPEIEESSRMAFGYSLLRSATFNTPPHVWVHVARIDAANSTPDKKVYLPPTREELTRGAAAALGLGGISNIHIGNEIIYSPSLQEEYRSTFATAKEWTDKLGRKNTAISHVGVFFSERLRWRDAGSQEAFWFQGNLPAVASFDVLNEQGVPVQVVVDRELARGLPAYMKAIVITDPQESLTDRQRDQLRAFAARGGQIIDASNRSWAPDAYTVSRAWLAGRLAPVISSSFVRVIFPSTIKQRTFVALAERTTGDVGKILLIPNDFSWVQRKGPDEVNVRNVVRGVSLSFPRSSKAPEVTNLTTTTPIKLTVVKDSVSGGWTVELPPSSADLGIYGIS